jgi:tetrahydromethanopterin S-methyltransferase subunit G
MPTTLPRTVRDAWGEEVADEFSSWLDENFQQRTVSRGEFREILSRLDVLEERFDQQDARFEERLEAQNKHFEERFDEVGARLDRMEKRFGSMDEKLDRMNGRILSMTRWLIGLLVAFGTMIIVLLSIAQFTG